MSNQLEKMDLHRVKHQDVRAKLSRCLEDLFQSSKEVNLEIVTGNSDKMKKVVMEILEDYGIEYDKPNPLRNNTGYLTAYIDNRVNSHKKKGMKMKRGIVLGLLVAFMASGCIYNAGDVKDHKASFLFDNAGTRAMNILSEDVVDGSFHGVVNRCLGNGDKVVYLYLSNYRDGPEVSFYQNRQFGGTVDESRIKQMTKRMETCIDKDLQIVAWLFADDSSPISKASEATQKKYIDDAVDNFDKYISEYVVALEADEHLKLDRCAALSAHLDSKTKKKIGMHQVPGKYNYSQAIGNVNHHYHQYGFGKSASSIESSTRNVIGAVGKPVVAAEYDKSSDSAGAKERGDAAMRGGAIGTGNGRN